MGESGVGKELVAGDPFSSPRRGGAVHLPQLRGVDRDLAGERTVWAREGAFTGATEKLIGKFESADRGTIFLDEIGEMNLGTQSKFLRVLEGHPFERVGGNTPIKVNVRVVAATNQTLEQAVRQGTFRRDLFFRLQVVEIRVPPLRDRPDDTPMLAEHFLEAVHPRNGPADQGIPPALVRPRLPLAGQRPRVAKRSSGRSHSDSVRCWTRRPLAIIAGPDRPSVPRRARPRTGHGSSTRWKRSTSSGR